MLGLLAAGWVSFLLSVFGTVWLIALLRRKGVGQPIHESVTQHAHKAGTPTMGGIALSVVAPVAYLAGTAAIGEGPGRTGLTMLGGIVAGGVVGAIDDWLKVKRGRNTLGLREKQKSILLLLVAALVVASSNSTACHAPSLARCGPLPDIGIWPWALWVLVVVWLTTNSVNFADGADGLLLGCSLPPLSLLIAIAYWQHRHPDIYRTDDALAMAIVLTAVVGGCLGLLWWNAAPAQVIIGETGSLAIGTTIAIAALRLNVELLVPVFGAVYVAQGFSSFAQRVWFKTTRRLRADHQPQRLFRMAPLHHHFELLGWPETHVVIRFWILSWCGSAIAGVIFYADAVQAL